MNGSAIMGLNTVATVRDQAVEPRRLELRVRVKPPRVV